MLHIEYQSTKDSVSKCSQRAPEPGHTKLKMFNAFQF